MWKTAPEVLLTLNSDIGDLPFIGILVEVSRSEMILTELSGLNITKIVSCSFTFNIIMDVFRLTAQHVKEKHCLFEFQ